MNDVVQGTAEWREARNAGIGGSEIAALYPKPGSKTGTYHPYLSQFQLWAIKTGRAESPKADPIESPELWWGSELEPIVRRVYTLITGRVVVDGVTMLRHPEVACMVANTDGRIVGVEGRPGDGVYEGKTTTIFKADEWRDTVPLHIEAQVQHYMACTGLQWGSVAVRIDGYRQPIEYRDIDRNQRFIDDMCERADRWWSKHVVRDDPPPVDGSDSTTKIIAGLHPSTSTGSVIELGEDWLGHMVELEEIASAIKDLKLRKTQLQNELRMTLGEAEYGRLPDGSGWSLRTQKRKGYTKIVAPAEFRVLKRVKKVKSDE